MPRTKSSPAPHPSPLHSPRAAVRLATAHRHLLLDTHLFRRCQLLPPKPQARKSGGVPRRALLNLRWGNAWMAAPPGHPFVGYLLSQLASSAQHANVRG